MDKFIHHTMPTNLAYDAESAFQIYICIDNKQIYN